MKKYLGIIFFAAVGFYSTSCESEAIAPEAPCEWTGVVRDYSGLDGCGFVIIRSDGKVFEPIMLQLFCATPPIPDEIKNNPLYDFNLYDGQMVSFHGDLTPEMATICMTGTPLRISCIRELGCETLPTP